MVDIPLESGDSYALNMHWSGKTIILKCSEIEVDQVRIVLTKPEVEVLIKKLQSLIA